MKDLNHLSEIFHYYDTYVIDLWGVIHNGISLNPKAIEAIENLSKNSKKIVFLSNAPRSSSKVIDFLKRMKMNEKFLSRVITSGEAAMQAINKNKFGKKFYHLGPSRDQSVFEKVLENKFITIDDSENSCSRRVSNWFVWSSSLNNASKSNMIDKFEPSKS